MCFLGGGMKKYCVKHVKELGMALFENKKLYEITLNNTEGVAQGSIVVNQSSLNFGMCIRVFGFKIELASRPIHLIEAYLFPGFKCAPGDILMIVNNAFEEGQHKPYSKEHVC
jgi:hypothetical protein